MMIIDKWKRAFRLQCEGCGAIGPLAFYKIDAVRQAEAEGWRPASDLGSQTGEPDLCPFCVKARDDEEAYRDYRDEQDDKAAVRAGVG